MDKLSYFVQLFRMSVIRYLSVILNLHHLLSEYFLSFSTWENCVFIIVKIIPYIELFYIKVSNSSEILKCPSLEYFFQSKSYNLAAHIIYHCHNRILLDFTAIFNSDCKVHFSVVESTSFLLLIVFVYATFHVNISSLYLSV